jgi:hypothetical protein
LGFLFLGQTIGFARHLVETSVGVLLLRASEQVGGFAEAVGGAAGFGVTLLPGRGAAHVVVSLLQAFESLLNARVILTLLTLTLLTLIRVLIRTLLAGLAPLSRLSCLSRLSGLFRLP